MANYKIGDIGKVSKRPMLVCPDKDEQRKIKASLGLRQNESFFKCRAKSRHRVKAFEDAGDMSHSKKDHICPECRCHHVAGANTEHYGLGYCFEHENVTGASRKNSKSIVEHQGEAMRLGYPDKVYKYQTQDSYLEKVRKQADESGGNMDLIEEINLLRAKTQELMSMYDGKEGLTEGYNKDGSVKQMTDATYLKLIGTLLTQVGRLTATNLTVTENDYVHIDQVNTWFAQVIRIIQQEVEAEHKDIFDVIIDQVKLVPQMKKGRIK